MASRLISNRSSTSTVQLPAKLSDAVKAVCQTVDGERDPPLRYLILYGGRGSAKSHSVARLLVNVAVHRPIRFLCTREIQKSIEESVHQLLADTIKALDYEDAFTIGKTEITGVNGSQFIFAGLRTQDITKLKSTENVSICWVEEAHVVSDKSWDVLIPTIRAENSIIIATFNPELEDDPVYERFVATQRDNAIVVKMNYRDNPWFPAVLEEERAHLEETDKSHEKAKYRHIWEGETLPAVEGAIFAREVAELQESGRIRLLDYDPKGLVHVIMDLGYGVMSAILAQKFASTVQIIGYHELTQSTYYDLTKELEQLDYRWGKVFMPHDASHKDPKYGKSHFDVMGELGWKTASIPQIGVENYIEAARTLFENLYVSDSAKCKRLIHCLKRWKRHVPTTTEHPSVPVKDEFSHGAEAFCYAAVVADQMTNTEVSISDPYKSMRGKGWAA